jgi:hypothetical protein
MSQKVQQESQSFSDSVRLAAKDKTLKIQRGRLARFSAKVFSRVGTELHLLGHIVGSDRTSGVSPFGHGSDEAVAVSLLLRIAGQLISSSTDLFEDGRTYAAAALLRQMVEIEYLAWAMETRNREGERWIRSSREERQAFFTPAKIRKAAQGKFRGKDYGYHCELGGHPVPGAGILLGDDAVVPQLLLADLLGHVGRIWDHLVGWSRRNSSGEAILTRGPEMSKRFGAWKSKDPLSALPPPP